MRVVVCVCVKHFSSFTALPQGTACLTFSIILLVRISGELCSVQYFGFGPFFWWRRGSRVVLNGGTGIVCPEVHVHCPLCSVNPRGDGTTSQRSGLKGATKERKKDEPPHQVC